MSLKRNIVWKVNLEFKPKQQVPLPIEAKILSVGMIGANCNLWMLCDPDAAKEIRKINMIGVNSPFMFEPGVLLGRVIAPSGDVYHVFEDVSHAN